MARYDGRATRRTKKPTELDPDSQEYWEAVLRREGLSMERGRHCKLSYHAPQTLELIAAARQRDEKEPQ